MRNLREIFFQKKIKNSLALPEKHCLTYLCPTVAATMLFSMIFPPTAHRNYICLTNFQN
jgi:hypothetical protein